MQKTQLVIILFLVVLVAGFVMRSMLVGRAPSARETFMQKEIGAPSDGTSIGPYDSKSQPGASGWLPNEKAPEGASPLDDTQSGKLMFLSDPKVSSSCCPSAFNTDQGCVCLSESDKKLMATRGGNRG
jgi:hypothetical protein